MTWVNDPDKVKVTDLKKLQALRKDGFSDAVIFENSNPKSWITLQGIRESGGAYRRLGFKTWEVFLPQRTSEVSSEISSPRSVVIARAMILIILVLICVWELSTHLPSLINNWPELEKSFKDYPFLSALLSGAILALPFGVFYRWTNKAVKKYLGLSR